ncbi:hypothetical protein CSOJ01_11843 [Colletotrichum sojae]|uniref:Uncharacterized protein n=1 Tax=Colletotrichum sojae TaxID=2175907 RepID=A0A8H6MN37_9PEZI|nr:hypothetical protein CSOJ01_11843 [Colletotrichum sojae]
MAGTAPKDPPPSGHASNPGLEQTSLDSNQHGQAQNIIDETKDTHGSTAVDRNIGETIDATKSKSKSGISSRVDDVLNKTSAGSSGTSRAEGRGMSTSERGFKVGEEADMHGLASSKQP